MSKFRFSGKIVKGVKFVDDFHYTEKALDILKCVGNLRRVGNTGTGKTTLVYHLAQKLGLPLFECVLTRDTSRWDLLATDTLSKGETEIREGLIMAWLKSEKGILYLDGFNYAEPNIVSLTESLADFRGSIFIPELNEIFSRKKEHYLIISYNPAEKSGFSGTFVSNIATIRRFEGLVIEYMGESSETKLLKKIYPDYEWCRKFVELASKTRTLYEEGDFCSPITTGNLLNYSKLKKNGMADSDIIEIASSLFKESQRETFRHLFEDLAKSKEIKESI